MKIISLFLVMIFAVGLVSAQTAQTDEATRLSVEAVKLFKEKKYAEAAAVGEKVVQMQTQQLGANHLKTGEALRNLGFIQRAGGGSKEQAEESLEKAIAIYRAQTDLNQDLQVQLAQMLETVAFYKFERRKIEKAREFYAATLELREKINGADALETTSSLWALGNIYQYQKDFASAEKMYRRVLEIRAKKLAKNDWEIQNAQSFYYCMSVRNDKGEEALNFIKSLNPGVSTDNQPKAGSNHISGGIVNGKATNLGRPEYPMEARTARAGGQVSVQTTIDEQGKVIFACAISGNKLLYDATESAAYRSTFQPTTLMGKPVKVTGVIVYNFVP